MSKELRLDVLLVRLGVLLGVLVLALMGFGPRCTRPPPTLAACSAMCAALWKMSLRLMSASPKTRR